MPKWTNKYGVHPAIARAVLFDPWRQRGDATVSQLIRPPLMAYLERKHDAEITIDVADRLFALRGQMIHEVLRRARLDNALQEQALMMNVAGWEIGGRPDLWMAESPTKYDIELTGDPADPFRFVVPPGGKVLKNVLSDFKDTSVWAFQFGEKPEWSMQLNSYAVLYRHANFDVDVLEIPAMLHDWNKRKADEAGREEGSKYPPAPFQRIYFDVLPNVEALERLEERVQLHKDARAGNARGCTEEERWAKPDKFAVMKHGQKKAVKVKGLESATDAEAFKNAKDPAGTRGLYTETRRGDKLTRCEHWCDARPFCPVYPQLKAFAEKQALDDAARIANRIRRHDTVVMTREVAA